MAVSAQWRSDVADRVQALLRLKGLTTKEFIDRSALPAEQVEAILNARVVQFRARDLEAIAAVLGTDVYTLFLPTDAQLEVVPFQEIKQGRSRHP